MSTINASFDNLYTATGVAEMMTAAGCGLVYRRRAAIAGTRQEREAAQLPAIARYTDLAHESIVAARGAIESRYSVAATGITPTEPNPASALGTPAQRQVEQGLTTTLERLSNTYDQSCDLLNEATFAKPFVRATANLAADVFDHLTAACGQWSIAHRAYQRATCQRRKPLGESDFGLQTAGLAYALRARVPEETWRLFDATIGGGEFGMTLQDIAAALTTHDIPITTVEQDTLVSLLYYGNHPSYPPSIADQLIIAPSDDIP